jgi:adenylate cyclase
VTEPEEQASNSDWRDTLLGIHPELVRMRSIFRHIPSDPRCKMCLSPQGGIGGPIMSILGFGRYPRNPQLCNSCFRAWEKHPGGAEIEITALFADIRGSTGLAETMSPSDYSAAVTAYVRIASRAVREPGGLVDKLLGDGVMAIFIPGFVGDDHAAKAATAARQIISESRVPVGVGIHTGPAWVGFVGGVNDVLDFTALGDAVNVASRLGSDAGPGEILLSSASAAAARVDASGLERRTIDIRGRTDPIEVVAERVSQAAAPAVPG